MDTKRPRVNDEIIMQAAVKVAETLGDADAKTIADHYRDPMDGYELAKELDKWCGWDISTEDVDILDDMHWIVCELVRDAEKRWQAENNIQPKLACGTRIKQGVIWGVSEYSAARYEVKENGCTKEGRFLLVKFEDAEEVLDGN